MTAVRRAARDRGGFRRDDRGAARDRAGGFRRAMTVAVASAVR